jgi:phosphoglycerate-specific signal transduction histidine kinase
MEIRPLKPVDQSEDLISTLSQMVPNMLNKDHRKKLKKLNEKVTHLHNDFTSIFHDIANFP